MNQCPNCKSGDILALHYACLRCNSTFSAFNGQDSAVLMYVVQAIEIFLKMDKHALKIGYYYFDADLELRNDLSRHKNLRQEIADSGKFTVEQLDELERVIDGILNPLLGKGE